MRILNEYIQQKELSFSGQPGVGDAFFRWALNNQANLLRCDLVEIHPRNNSEYDFEEFSDDPDLERFDQSDRKFVAVARANQHQPSILNLVDSDWWSFRESLVKHGVTVEFSCPGQFDSKA